MKFGVADYGINVWDGDLYDVQTRLEELKSIGFDGIERLSASSPSDAMNLAEKFHRLGMDFSTVRGPSVANGLSWTCALGKPYVWLTPGGIDREVPFDLFCRRARRFTDVAGKMNLDAALHNHLGQRVETQEELDLFMKEVPNAKLLLDIGHLAGAGGDPVAAIEKYSGRIAAVHFKDIEKTGADGKFLWDRIKFRRLDGGNAGFDWRACVKALKKVGYDKWCLIEQDNHVEDPLAELKMSLDLLKKTFTEA